jgi:tetratricopeptide (TPR) repeat protein
LGRAQGEAPRAATYPAEIEGWPVAQRLVPGLPDLYLPTLDYYGPLPPVATLQPAQVDSGANPFLTYRFAVNAPRRRLVFFDINSYMSDPSLVLEPPYLLALLLLPLLLWRIRSNIGAQFAVGSSAAVLLVMFNPLLTPLVGSLVMPWLLWRVVWLLPYALVIAMILERCVAVLVALAARPFRPRESKKQRLEGLALASFVVMAGLALGPAIQRNLWDLEDRAASPLSYFPVPEALFARLRALTMDTGPATVLADQDLSVTLPAYVANASIVAHRMPTTSEVFPADRQDEALQRLIDQARFFEAPYLTEESLDILRRYDVRYILASSGTDLDAQLRLAVPWFEPLADDHSYSLYAVREAPEVTAAIRGNTALAAYDWTAAEEAYREALERDSGDLLALAGLAEIAHVHGDFAQAVAWLEQAAGRIDLPHLDYRLGQLYAEGGRLAESREAFGRAQDEAPQVPRFHEALGDACLTVGDEACAAEQYRQAAAAELLPGDDARLLAEAALWRQRGRLDRALALSQQAVALRPSVFNRLSMVEILRESGQFEDAERQLVYLKSLYPLSSELLAVWAEVAASRGDIEQAGARFAQTLRLQKLQAQDTVPVRLALAEALLDANLLDEAAAELAQVVALRPADATAHRLQGDIYLRQRRHEEAAAAYRRSLELDPAQVEAYISLRNNLGPRGGTPEELVELLQAAVRANPNEISLLLDLGDQLQRVGDAEEAAAAYRLALMKLEEFDVSARLRPRALSLTRAFVYARLAGLHEDLGQLHQAMNFYQAAVSAAPDAEWAQVLLGDAQRRRGDMAAAEAAYRAAIELDDESATAYARLADLLYATGRAAEAVAYARAVPAMALAGLEEPAPSTAGNGVGPLLAQLPPSLASQQSGETAVASVSRALAEIRALETGDAVEPLGPGPRPAPVADLPGSQQLGSRVAEAVTAFREVIDRALRENWEPALIARRYKDLGDLYAAGNQWDGAEEAYRQALALDGWLSDAYLALADIAQRRADRDTSLRHARSAVDVAPGSAETQLALAHALDGQGDEEQAFAMIQQIAAAHPGHAQATLALAQAMQERERDQEAEAAYLQSIAMNAGVPAGYVGLSEVYVDQGRFPEARALLEQAMAIDALDVAAYVRMGDLENRMGNFQRARDWYVRAAALSPAGHPANMDLLASLVRYGNYDLALAFLGDMLAKRPEDLGLLLTQAEVDLATGRLEEAAGALFQARLAAPDAADVYAATGDLFALRGRPRDALANYRRAIELQPGEANNYLVAARILVSLGHPDEALALLQGGLQQSREPTVLFIAEHDLHLAQGRVAEALAALEAGIEDMGPSPELALALVGHYVRTGDPSRAEEQLQQAAERYPDLPEVWLAKAGLSSWEESLDGEALAEGSRPARLEAAQAAQAIKSYAEALVADPTRADAYTGLAAVYEAQGRPAEARAIYERGLRYVPLSGELLSAYAAFLAGQGEAEQALAMLDEAIARAPMGTTRLARARLLTKLDRNDDALQDVQAALDAEPGAVDALLLLGDLHVAGKENGEARAAFERVIELVPGNPLGYLRLASLARSEGKAAQAGQYADRARQVSQGLALPAEDAGE